MLGKAKRALLLGAAFALGAATFAFAQEDAPTPGARGPRPPVSSYPKPAPFPNENKAAVSKYLSQARKIAGEDLFQDFAHRCIMSPEHPVRVRGIQYNGILEPTKLFDQLYSIGQVSVSSHALVTSDGIVIFDTLNNEDEARNIIVPNLQKLGLDPKNIKYIVITHSHGDHYGGAAYLQKTYGAKVISSKLDWDVMDKMRANAASAGPFGAPPERDIDIVDGQEFKVGDTTLKFYVTPGHTVGTVSTIFKVTDHGAPHIVGYHGGTGGGRNPESLRAGIKGYQHWLDVTKAAGVDTLIANHPLHDRGIERNELLTYAQPGDPNPYVLGKDRYQRYMQVMQACSRVHLARFGFTE